MLIQPTGGSFTIAGAIAGPLIELNGADNVTMDGLNSGGNALTVSNSNSSSSSAATVRFVNDATGNVIRNCTIEGSAIGSARGVVWFSDASSGVTGNDNNTISANDIKPAGANLPRYAIYGSGTSGKENSVVVISGNTIHDFFSPDANSNTTGIFVSSGNTDWTISNNKIYQTAPRTFSWRRPDLFRYRHLQHRRQQFPDLRQHYRIRRSRRHGYDH